MHLKYLLYCIAKPYLPELWQTLVWDVALCQKAASRLLLSSHRKQWVLKTDDFVLIDMSQPVERSLCLSQQSHQMNTHPLVTPYIFFFYLPREL